MKVKIFDTSAIPGGRDLESVINQWLANTQLSRIKYIKVANPGGQSSYNTKVLIFYEESNA